MVALREAGTPPTPPNRSSACLRSSSFWACARRALFSASVSSSSSSSSVSSPASFRRWRSAIFSCRRLALDFLFALASASALALASSAFLAFSRSTSESSAASQESSTCVLEVSGRFWGNDQAGLGGGRKHTSSWSSSSSNLRRLATPPWVVSSGALEASDASSSSIRQGTGQLCKTIMPWVPFSATLASMLYTNGRQVA